VDSQAREFRSKVSALVRRDPTEPYPEELRQEAVAYARSQMTRGVSGCAVAEALGMCTTTLRRWLLAGEGAELSDGHEPYFVQVEVAESEPPASGLRLVSPSGWRVEGLAFSEAICLIRQLP